MSDNEKLEQVQDLFMRVEGLERLAHILEKLVLHKEDSMSTTVTMDERQEKVQDGPDTEKEQLRQQVKSLESSVKSLESEIRKSNYRITFLLRTIESLEAKDSN